MRPAAAAAADLVLGSCCPGCGRPGWGPCRACRGCLAGPARAVLRAAPGFPAPVFATSAYAGPVRDLVVAYKERQAWRLAPVLAGALVHAVAAVGLADAGVLGWRLVPVPSAPARVRDRGLDTTAVLARRAAAELRREGIAVTAVDALRQRAAVADQAGLGASARWANLAGRLIAELPPGPPVIVVDDVVTTGASLAEAARALGAAGGVVAGAAVVAARGWR